MLHALYAIYYNMYAIMQYSINISVIFYRQHDFELNETCYMLRAIFEIIPWAMCTVYILKACCSETSLVHYLQHAICYMLTLRCTLGEPFDLLQIAPTQSMIC